MNVITPETDIQDIKKHSVFLSGSMGEIDGKPWRKHIIDRFKNINDNDWSIIDPSVDDLENVVGEESLNNPKYINQISWERNMIFNSDVVFMAFTKDSPTLGSLLEFSLVYMTRDNIIVFIEEGYEKEAALTFYCQERRINVTNNFNKAINQLSLFLALSKIS